MSGIDNRSHLRPDVIMQIAGWLVRIPMDKFLGQLLQYDYWSNGVDFISISRRICGSTLTPCHVRIGFFSTGLQCVPFRDYSPRKFVELMDCVTRQKRRTGVDRKLKLGRLFGALRARLLPNGYDGRALRMLRAWGAWSIDVTTYDGALVFRIAQVFSDTLERLERTKDARSAEAFLESHEQQLCKKIGSTSFADGIWSTYQSIRYTIAHFTGEVPKELLPRSAGCGA